MFISVQTGTRTKTGGGDLDPGNTEGGPGPGVERGRRGGEVGPVRGEFLPQQIGREV